MKIEVNLPSPVQKVIGLDWPIDLFVKREDLIHPVVSGNKYRKLKYNLAFAREQQYQGILSFGGAYSNHIHALAFACRHASLSSVGIIRGEDDPNNPTLAFARQCGMKLHFVSRTAYRDKEKNDEVNTIIALYPNFLMVPEGGSNDLALAGVGELIHETNINDFDILAVCAGTGYTAAGILKELKNLPNPVRVIVFSALKGDFLKAIIAEKSGNEDFIFTDKYCQGGYAKTNEDLLQFIRHFEHQTGIEIDYVYNGKLLYGLQDMVKQQIIAPQSKVLWIHTGGLQGKIKSNE